MTLNIKGLTYPADASKPWAVSQDGIKAISWHKSRQDAVKAIKRKYGRIKLHYVRADGRVITYNTRPNQVQWNAKTKSWVPYVDIANCITIVHCGPLAQVGIELKESQDG